MSTKAIAGIVSAAVLAIAIALIVALSGHGSSGSSGSSGTDAYALDHGSPAAISVCIASRLANGNAAAQAENPAEAQASARYLCSMGNAFNSSTEPGVDGGAAGPNTAN